MKKFLTIGWILFVGCSNSITDEDLQHLNGYWEIEKVTFADGTVKNYTVNTVIDFIKIENRKGFRKKVSPKLDGTYNTSNDAEPFRIVDTKNRYFMRYENELSERKEELNTLTVQKFSVTNEDGITYTYKRFEPIKVNE